MRGGISGNIPWTGFARDPSIYAVFGISIIYSNYTSAFLSVFAVVFFFFSFHNSFCFNASFILFLSIRSVSFIQLRYFIRTLGSFQKLLLAPFNRNVWNDPASVRKILVEFLFLSHFKAFKAISGLLKCQFLANLRGFLDFLNLKSPQNRPK